MYSIGVCVINEGSFRNLDVESGFLRCKISVDEVFMRESVVIGEISFFIMWDNIKDSFRALCPHLIYYVYNI